jgi:hypothetical protein
LRPLVWIFKLDKSTVRVFAGIDTRFHPLKIEPLADNTVNVAVEYVLAAGAVSLKDLHCWIDELDEHASRGTITGAENSATEGGVVHVDCPVMASIVEIVPLSVLVQIQFGFCESIVAVYAETLTGQFPHAAPAPPDKLVSKQ